MMERKKRSLPVSPDSETATEWKKSRTRLEPNNHSTLSTSPSRLQSESVSVKKSCNERAGFTLSTLNSISNQYSTKKSTNESTFRAKELDDSITGGEQYKSPYIKSSETYLECPVQPNSISSASDFDPEAIALLKRRVRECLIRMRQTKAVQKLRKIKEAHKFNLKATEKLLLRHEALESEFIIERLEFPAIQSTGKMFKLVGNTIQRQNMSAFQMPAQIELPTMRQWEPIQTNNYCPDETYLYNIPYLNEDLAINGDKFYNELTQNYKGIHDNYRDSDEFEMVDYRIDDVSYHYLVRELPSNGHMLKDDQLFYKLVNDLSEDQTVSIKQLKENRLFNDKKSIGLIDHIFQAISERYPRIGVYREIKNRYQTLHDLHDKPKKHIKCEQHPFNLKPIDNLDGDDQTNFGDREHMLNNFKELFCKRCFRYDCLLHIHSLSSFYSISTMQSQRFDIKFDCTPCNRNCFFYQDHVQQALSKQPQELIRKARTKKSSTKRRARTQTTLLTNGNNTDSSQDSKQTENALQVSVSDHLADENELDYLRNELYFGPRCNCGEWTGAEQTLLRCLLDVYKNVNNFCCIAEAMQTKCCFHIYQYTANTVMTNEPYENFLIFTDFNLIDNNHIIQAKPVAKSSKYGRSCKKRSSNYYLSTTFKEQIKNDDTNVFSYTPCFHPGQACDEKCFCLRFMGFCEKYCNCPPDCHQRFKGCKCRAQCTTNQCSCFLGKRECDPDLCGTCGASNFEVQDTKCKNICTQKSLKKHLLLAPSKVSGWGIFSKDSIQKGEFISEYCGEIISQKEAEKRGKVYDEYKCSFLFNLDNDYSVDATRKGNKIRFANHSKMPNCDCKIVTVNGEQRRIAVFAKQPIAAGEELFLDYRYGLQEQLKYVPIEK